MRLEVNVDHLAGPDRFDSWREQTYVAIGMSSNAPAGGFPRFRGRMTGRAGGPLLNMQFEADSCPVERSERHIAARPWDSYFIYREESAGAWFDQRGQEFVTTPGQLVLVDADRPFKTHALDRYRHQSWLIPKPLLDPHLPALGRPAFLPLPGSAGLGVLAGSYLEALTRNWDELAATGMEVAADTLCRLIGVACGAAVEDRTSAVMEGRLAEAKKHIERRLSDPRLSPASVAASMRISLRTLHSAFEPSGTTFSRHVQRRRLEECRLALLANPSRPVLDVAFAWGFTSLSSFYRAFGELFGVAPGDLRSR